LIVFYRKMSLDTKLQALARLPETVTLRDLLGRPPALIVGARRVTTRFGRPAVVLDIEGENLVSSVFLPGKYGDMLGDADLETLVTGGYVLQATGGEDGSMPTAVISKKK
jgi:hypothetical protein